MEKLIDFKKLTDKEKELLSFVMQYKSITRKELSELLGLKNATLYRMIDSFILSGILTACKYNDFSSVGRPSDLIKLNSNYGYFYSICIRRFSYEVALIDFNFNFIERCKFTCDENSNKDDIRETCYTTYLDLLKKNKIDEDKIIGIAVSSFNTAKDHYSTEFHHPGFSWGELDDIRLFFAQRFDKNIFFGNVALSAACSKYYDSYFPKYRNLAYIILDEGIGIGYIIDRKIARLSMRNVNALGHMIIDIHGPKCYCGQYGCLESIVNDFVIVKRTQDELKVRKDGLLYQKIDNLTIEDICNAAEQNDAIGSQELEYAASVLSIGIENFLKLFKLEVISINGKLVEDSSFFFRTLKEKLVRRHPSLIVQADDQIWENSLKGIAQWYMHEILSLTPLTDLIR